MFREVRSQFRDGDGGGDDDKRGAPARQGEIGGGTAWWRPQHRSLEAGGTGGLDEHAMCWNAGARHGELVPSTCRASGGGERPRVWVVGRAAGRLTLELRRQTAR